MIAAFSVDIAVAAFDNQLEIGIGRLYAGRDRKRPAMQAIEVTKVIILRSFCGMTDPGTIDKPLSWYAKFIENLKHDLSYSIIAAARAPGNLIWAVKILHG